MTHLNPLDSPSAMKLAAVIALSLATSGGAFAQATVHVDGSVTAPGDGSLSAPYATITEALDDPQTGGNSLVIIEVAPGTYRETLVCEGRHFLLAPAGPTETILKPAADADTLLTLPEFTGQLNVQGFTLEGTGQSTGLYVETFCRAWLRDCVVRGHAIGAENLYDLHILNCTFVNNGVSTIETLGPSMLSPFTYLYDSILYSQSADPSTFTTESNCLIGVDPHFASYPGDVHLRPSSPAVPMGAGAFLFDPLWPAQSTGCQGGLNSLSLSGRALASGSASLAAGDLVIEGDRMPPGQTVLLVHSTEAASSPLGASTLCVGGAIVRADLGTTDGSGFVSIPFDPAVGPVAAPVLPGESLHFQLWHRDTAAPDFFGLTGSTRITFAP